MIYKAVRFFFFALLAIVTVCPVSATISVAAESNLLNFGLCYDPDGKIIDCAGTGQDGELQAGVAWPEPRFIDNRDGTVTDNLTGLMWLKDAGCMGQAT